MGKKKETAVVYRMELTEEQMRVTQAALEEWFRLRMGQNYEFTSDIASMNEDLSPDRPDHERIFDRYLIKRNYLDELMRAFFRIAFGQYGVPDEKTGDMLIAECVWDAMRFARGQSRWDAPYQIGSEPVPKITKVE